ncbi:PREDICTED: ras-related protein Ral-B-like [Trachymyrmex cornetzi]|uniref:GTP-binding protein Rhes n=1 Tax=Trachymyrmex cornetzi TaxID=471704 RepID=A0A151IWA1_9HYME|nr:PREDICTED: ras-related protein Ral-B-like [Trachymyrmex cornetzi]KYN12062.1 hypothetical protein ALC57_15770 [Trachymyrmex cornetzi]
MSGSQIGCPFRPHPSAHLKEGQKDGTTKNIRNEKATKSHSNSGKSSESWVRHTIVVMGPPKVGKTAIIKRFVYNTFSRKYKQMVGNNHPMDFNVYGNKYIRFDFQDLSNFDEFPPMRELFITTAEAFILVYDVNDSNTFLEVEALRAQIHSTKGAIPIVVVGNKIDLVGTEKEVETERTREFVTTTWKNGFVEVSAKDDLNINQMFEQLLIQAKWEYDLRPALRHRQQSLPPPQHSNSRSNSSSTPSATRLHFQDRERSDRNCCIL